MSETDSAGADGDLDAAGLLEGMHGDARAERLELLRWLREDQGYALEDLQRATESQTLVLMPSERVIGGEHRLTEAQVAQQAGVSPEFLRALSQANGIPVSVEDSELAVYTEIEVQAARMARSFVDAGLSEDQVLGVARVLGRSFAQIAEMMRQLTFELVLSPGSTELELARSYQAASQQLVPSLGPLLQTVLNLHLRNAVATEIVTAQERSAGALPGAREVVVGFADLVGFTRMGEEVPPETLGAVAGRLEDLAAEAVAAPVRVVKTIGDAVLLVSTDAAAMVHASLDLVDVAAAEGEDFPQLRVGIASGPAVSRAGDWFGAPVNLASRLSGVARAGSVVATEEVSEAVGEQVAWSFAGAKRLKNVTHEVKLFRARRVEDADGATSSDSAGDGQGRSDEDERSSRRRRRSRR